MGDTYCLSPRWPWNAYVTASGMEIRNDDTGERLHTFGEAALQLNRLEESLRDAAAAKVPTEVPTGNGDDRASL